MKCHIRACILFSIISVCLWVLCLKLYILSSVQNKSMTVLDGQYTSKLNIAERSGFIYDRYFNLLSHDKSTGILIINPSDCRRPVEVSVKTADIAVSAAQSDILNKLREGVPFTVAVTDENAAVNLSNKYTGLYFCVSYTENTNTAQHLIGYSSDRQGVTGLRKSYSDLLYNRLYAKNYATFSGNALNASMSPLTIHDESYTSKDGIITTIDKELQEFCDSLSDKIPSGCIIVSDASNGEILALSSFPSYDASRLEDYLFSDKGELLNRAACSFTPGSVFKILVSACALEDNPDYLNFSHNCKGSIQVYDTTFNCHKLSGHGELSMTEAFANSCNCYYVALARKLGIEKIVQTAKKLGLDKPVCVDFLQETGHRFIDESNRTPGHLANISFGQGELCLSPPDMINVVTAATTGYLPQMRIILGEVNNGNGEYRKETEKTPVFSQKTVEHLCRMMEECVDNGTGRSAKIEGIKMGGKTATAQTGRFDQNGVEYVHKWFCGFCDGIEKRYVFCILCDETRENSTPPSVITKEICTFLKENGY